MERLFGSTSQTKILVLVGMLVGSYPTELATLSGCSLTTTLSYLDRLEDDGIIVSVREGKNRRISINPRYRARAELIALLKSMGLRNEEIQQSLRNLRRRPRRKQKRLWPST